MSLLDQLRRDLNPSLNVNKDLSFTPVKNSLAALYTEQLQVTKSSVSNSITTLLNLMTVAQLDNTIDYHCAIEWRNPLTTTAMRLCGILKDGSTWLLQFENDNREHAGSFQAKELNLIDVIDFLDTIERVLDIPLQNTFKS